MSSLYSQRSCCWWEEGSVSNTSWATSYFWIFTVAQLRIITVSRCLAPFAFVSRCLQEQFFVLFCFVSVVSCVFVFQIDILRPLCFSGREIHPESKIETVMVAVQVEHIAAASRLLFLLLDRKLKLLVRQYLHISYTILGSSFFLSFSSQYTYKTSGEGGLWRRQQLLFLVLLETPANEIISFFFFFFFFYGLRGEGK
jgi:hypothetical protein